MNKFQEMCEATNEININKKHRNTPKQTLMASRKSRLSSSQENPGNCSALQRWVPVPQILSCAAHLWDPFQQLPGLYNSATAPYVSERSADQTSTFQSCTWKHRIHPWSLVAWHNWSPSFQQQESAVRSINIAHGLEHACGQQRSPHVQEVSALNMPRAWETLAIGDGPIAHKSLKCLQSRQLQIFRPSQPDSPLNRVDFNLY